MALEKLRTVFTGRVITVTVETVRLPNDHVVELEIVHHPGGAATVALDGEGRVCLLRQFRHATNGWVWELPAGKLEPGESPLVTAQRELVEEAGAEARHWESLGAYVTSPGVFTETVHLFLAKGLNLVRMSHESAEMIEVHWLNFEQACHRAANGEIADGKSALGLLRAQARLTT